MDEPQSQVGMATKRRRRPPLACEQCRHRKIRCDKTQPCHNCRKYKNASCTYSQVAAPASGKRAAAPSYTTPLQGMTSSQSPSQAQHGSGATPPANGDATDHSAPASYVGHLMSTEYSSGRPSTVSKMSYDTFLDRMEQTEQKLASGVIFHDDVASLRQELDVKKLQQLSQDMVSKSRYFGPSHWKKGADVFPVEVGVLLQSYKSKNELFEKLRDAKAIGKVVKDNRLGKVSPSPVTTGSNMPPRTVADRLVELYLGSFEGVLRILHVPSFRKHYDTFWQDNESVPRYFSVQLKLCMALGASLYDEHFSFRKSAVQWVTEGQEWVAMPPEKSRLNMAGLQIHCLLVQAKEVCGVGSDLAWISAGSLIRNAMYMGLHRDPKHLVQMSILRAEMRRRLWATVLELNLQTTMSAGGSSFLFQRDYDTLPPAELDDEDLTDQVDRAEPGMAVSNGGNTTRTTLQVALLKSYELRTAIAKHVNDFRASKSYDETLRLTSELTKACRELNQTLSRASQPGPERYTISVIQRRLVELSVYRFFHTLHQPVMARSARDPKFFFSRRMAVDSARKMLIICGIIDAEKQPTADPDKATLHRLTINGSGPYRNLPLQAVFSMVSENLESRAEDNLELAAAPSVGDVDLEGALYATRDWSYKRLRSGDVSIKSYIFLSASCSHLQALEAGADDAAIEEKALKTAIEAARVALDAVKDLAYAEGASLEDCFVFKSNDEVASEVDMQQRTEIWRGGEMDWVLGDLPLPGAEGADFDWSAIFDDTFMAETGVDKFGA